MLSLLVVVVFFWWYGLVFCLFRFAGVSLGFGGFGIVC